MRKDIEETLRLQEIIGTPKRGIIFSDLDGVWFDENGNFAAPDPADLTILREAQDAGYWLVLNSNTAATTLAAFAEELTFNPLVIAENGAIVYIPGQDIQRYLSPLKSFFDGYRKRAVGKLSQNSDATVVVGDATWMIRSEELPTPLPGSTVYMVNGARECSFGVYTRVAGVDGKLLIDDVQTQQTESILTKLLFENSEGLICKRYPQLGSCLVKDPLVQKWQAVRWVIDQLPKNLSYFMIGDTENDSMESFYGKVVTCAVGNASRKLKQAAVRSGGLIAPDNLTLAKGANYVIRQILERG